MDPASSGTWTCIVQLACLHLDDLKGGPHWPYVLRGICVCLCVRFIPYVFDCCARLVLRKFTSTIS